MGGFSGNCKLMMSQLGLNKLALQKYKSLELQHLWSNLGQEWLDIVVALIFPGLSSNQYRWVYIVGQMRHGRIISTSKIKVPIVISPIHLL